MTRPYLQSLRVENLVVIERAEIELSPGLNVITGETGAGKTVLARALDLLLGAATPRNVVRADADAAYVEGRFVLPDGLLRDLAEQDDALSALVDSDACELTVARRVKDGRSRCLVEGRTCSRETLGRLVNELVRFYGQHEQRRLVLQAAQTQLLDSFGDGQGEALRGRYLAQRAEAVGLSRKVQQMTEANSQHQRERDLTIYELEELDALDMDSAEEPARLLQELRRLQDADDAQQACAAGLAAISGEVGALEALRTAQHALRAVFSDGETSLAHRLDSVDIELADISVELERIATGWQPDPERLQQVNARLAEIDRLARKHRVPASELIAVRSRLAREAADAADAPQALRRVQAEAEEALKAAVATSARLSAWRARHAPKLASRVTRALAELAMEDAKFDVILAPTDGEDAYRLSEHGGERVIFRLQANPGLQAADLADTASGGELSRVMLALIASTAAHSAGTVILDEPDAGIGGRTAHGVGRRLRELAETSQVLVISHLPQLACRADRHMVLRKTKSAGTARSTLTALENDGAIVDELCRMGGLAAGDVPARTAMQSLLDEAREESAAPRAAQLEAASVAQ